MSAALATGPSPKPAPPHTATSNAARTNTARASMGRSGSRRLNTPTLGTDITLQLSARTWQLLDDRPRERELVCSVWDRLDELERAGYDPGSIAALRFVLVHHQPTSTQQCRACRRWSWHRLWQRRSWPCVVWMQVHYELVGPLAGGGHHRRRC